MKTTTYTVRQSKSQQAIAAVTAYDTITATLADRAGIDVILVGDSVGTTLLGYETTIPVTLAAMLHHTAAVVRAKNRALIVADLPFAEGHREYARMFDSCTRLMQEAGAEAIKIEGGEPIASKVARLTAAGIPILGHIGLLPQQVLKLGRYRRFGKTEAEQRQLLADAQALEDAGAFAIIGEMIVPEVATDIAQRISIPLIGIGCGKGCDGQILVSTDLLGLTLGKVPSFAKAYVQLAQTVEQAFTHYAKDVREQCFPEP